MAGTPLFTNVRLATSTATTTSTQVTTGTSERLAPSAHVVLEADERPRVAARPNEAAGRWSRAFCRSRISESATRRTLAMAPRRASSVGLRGIAPTSARVDAQRLAEASGEQADDELDDRHHDQLERPQRQARARRQRGDRAHAVARPQRGVIEVGPAASRSSRWRARAAGADHDPGTAEVGPPAQVDVLAVEARSTGRTRRAPGTGRRGRAGTPTAGRTRRVTASCCSWSYSPGSTIGSTSPKRSTSEADVLQDVGVVPRRRAWARRSRRSSGTAPRRGGGWRRDRARRRRGRSRRTRCRPRRRRAPRWPPAPKPRVDAEVADRNASGSRAGSRSATGPRRRRRCHRRAGTASRGSGSPGGPTRRASRRTRGRRCGPRRPPPPAARASAGHRIPRATEAIGGAQRRTVIKLTSVRKVLVTVVVDDPSLRADASERASCRCPSR